MIDALTRPVGIPGKDRVQWGEHLCAFFNTRTDLLNLVVPYIKAGLEDNEFCLWITEDNMEQEAMEGMMHEGGTWGDTWQHLELRGRRGTA